MNNIYSYESIVRGGWIYQGRDTGIKKKKVRMIKEGGIFTSDMKGCLVEVGENLPTLPNVECTHRAGWGQSPPPGLAHKAGVFMNLP